MLQLSKSSLRTLRKMANIGGVDLIIKMSGTSVSGVAERILFRVGDAHAAYGRHAAGFLAFPLGSDPPGCPVQSVLSVTAAAHVRPSLGSPAARASLHQAISGPITTLTCDRVLSLFGNGVISLRVVKTERIWQAEKRAFRFWRVLGFDQCVDVHPEPEPPQPQPAHAGPSPPLEPDDMDLDCGEIDNVFLPAPAPPPGAAQQPPAMDEHEWATGLVSVVKGFLDDDHPDQDALEFVDASEALDQPDPKVDEAAPLDGDGEAAAAAASSSSSGMAAVDKAVVDYNEFLRERGIVEHSDGWIWKFSKTGDRDVYCYRQR